VNPSRRARRIVVAALLLAAALVVSACTGGSDAVDQTANTQFRYVAATKLGTVIKASDRKPAGPLSGELLSGGTYSLSSDRGHVVVLNFWATWCGPCVTETPQLDALYRQRKASGVRFVGLDVKDSRDSARDFVRDKDITYPIVFDPNAKTALQLGHIPAAGLPVTPVIDKQGRVAAVYIGSVLPADLAPVLNQLVAEP